MATHTRYYTLRKDDLNSFIVKLSRDHKVVAPVSKGYGNFAFAEVTSSNDIVLKYIPTILPPKKYFFPQRETILTFSTGRGENAEAILEHEDTVIFGVHTCDLNGIQCLNIVFSERPRDYNYLGRKDKITIIGLECSEYCDKDASCNLMNSNFPNGGYDLFFTDLGDAFMVHVNTQAGEDLVENANLFKPASPEQMAALYSLRDAKRALFKNEVAVDRKDIPAIFDKSENSAVWQKAGEKCVGCGNCTNVCPTCYCFDIADTMNLDLKSGRRVRSWDSCQVEPFARVAGGENFRSGQAERLRHRYYRKFRYSLGKYYRFFCTGCGRCTRACMAGIRLKETLAELVKEAL
ncbi:MAG: 4Fe-4S dicluster domain-containing protein [Elusimicrobiota bacterium]|nr:4Fe-4S dicluster domain-containing protein [Elusimicrobiota bacterium]